MCEFMAQGRNLSLLFSQEGGNRSELYSDCKRIKQILINLVVNAIKFTYSGSVQVRAHITRQETKVVAESSDSENDELMMDEKAEAQFDSVLHISITDTGVGMSEQDQRRLF